MDPDYLLFTRVVALGSLSAAARDMAISASMVSKRLSRLEARLGVRLINRTTRRLTPTAVGERLHADLGAIIGSLQAAEARVTGTLETPSGRLRVSAPTSFGRLHVAPHLHRFLAECPLVDLEFDLDDANVDLVATGVDIAIRITATPPGTLGADRLGDSRRILCAHPSYLARHGSPATVAALAGHRLIAAEGQLPWRLQHGKRTHALDGRSIVKTNSSEIVRELTLSGAGIALRSLWDVGSALEDGSLVQVLPEWEGPAGLGIFALYVRSPIVPPSLRAFIGFLVSALSPDGCKWIG